MANNYENDAVANWAFDAGSLLEDTLGSNTLTQTVSATHTVIADSGDNQEGNSCLRDQITWSATPADAVGTWTRANGSLSSDFPFKTGESNNAASWCFWFKMAYSEAGNPFRATNMSIDVGWGDVSSVVTDQKMRIRIQKGSAVDNGTIQLSVWDENDVVTSLLYDFATRWQFDVWYHVAVTYDLDSGDARIRVYDNSTGGTLQADKTSSSMPTTLLAIPSNDTFHVRISGDPGGANDIGLFTEYRVDDLVLFDRILTTDEIDEIRAFIFVPDTAPSGLTPFPSARPDDYNPDFFWQPDNWTGDTYVPSDWGPGYVATGGGRWGQQLVVVGKDLVYYEALT
jgi:hypothetical protein